MNLSFVNHVGSLLFLNIAETGSVRGIYVTESGSPGRFPVIGNVGATVASDGNRSLSLAVSWRPLDKQAYNPSWHWTSGYSGQLDHGCERQRLFLLHNLVATTDFDDQVSAGSMLARAEFQACDHPSIPELSIIWGGDAASDTALQRVKEWRSVTGSGMSIRIERADPQLWCVEAQLVFHSEVVRTSGFADLSANSEIELQSIALSGLLTDGRTLTVSGQIDVKQARIDVVAFINSSVPNRLLFTQTKIESYSLTPVSGLMTRPGGDAGTNPTLSCC